MSRKRNRGSRGKRKRQRQRHRQVTAAQPTGVPPDEWLAAILSDDMLTDDEIHLAHVLAMAATPEGLIVVPEEWAGGAPDE